MLLQIETISSRCSWKVNLHYINSSVFIILYF